MEEEGFTTVTTVVNAPSTEVTTGDDMTGLEVVDALALVEVDVEVVVVVAEEDV